MKHFPLDQGFPDRVVEEEGQKLCGRLQSLQLPSLNDTLPGIWMESSQSANSLSLQQWVQKIQLLSDVSEVLSLSFAPPDPTMNEPFTEATSSEPRWNFETKFLPVLGNLEVVWHVLVCASPGLSGHRGPRTWAGTDLNQGWGRS